MTYLMTKKVIKNMGEVEKKIASSLKIPVKTFYNGSRDGESSRARFILFYALHDIHGLPYKFIAERYNMHYSSIIHGVDMAKRYYLNKTIVW